MPQQLALSAAVAGLIDYLVCLFRLLPLDQIPYMKNNNLLSIIAHFRAMVSI